MGAEIECIGRWDGGEGPGRALLEGDHVLFRGAGRVKLRLTDLTAVTVEGDWLRLAAPGGTLDLALGAKAGSWAEKIRNPKTPFQKLGLKPAESVALIGPAPAALRDALRAAGIAEAPEGEAAVLFLCVEAPADLARLADLGPAMRPGQSLWLVHPKGRRDFAGMAMFEAGRGAG
ncbi:MAG TPA: hypothetical protein VEH84_11880, partial [Alphaproteobacteria bacterium]|nr:hypothetical protein [Alphaproteobacteria bacterium]